MQCKYEQTINAKSVLKINKVWVRNQGMIYGRQKKGELLIVMMNVNAHFFGVYIVLMWRFYVEKLILEMLANRTPPSSIQANIVSFCSHVLPGQDVIEELSCVKHIRDMRTVQLTVAKTLAGKRIGDAKQITQLHTDEMSKLQTQVTNALLSILQEDDTLKTVCLAGDIIGADGTAAEQVREIVQSFGEAGRLLEK